MVFWFKWVLLGYLFLGLALIVGILLYERLARAYMARKYPPPGKLVDIGGYKLHLHCTGEGRPTVILEDGPTFAGSLAWSKVQPEVAKFARVCSYDRAGILWSEPSPQPREARQMAMELHAALDKAQIAPPYVLVGLSVGGVYNRVFAELYPNEVVGMVLVEASHPDQEARFPVNQVKAFPSGRGASLLKGFAATGVLRLLHLWSDPNPSNVPTEVKKVSTGFMPRSTTALLQEMKSFEASFQSAKQAQPLGDKPLVVVTSSQASDLDDLPPGWTREYIKQRDEVWQTLQTELLWLSTNSQQLTAAHSGPLLYYDQPDLVIQAIRQVMDAVRLCYPLSGQRPEPLPSHKYAERLAS
ncbi:MAG: alpha/beta hydrolase [Cyanobacteria bacterium J06635_1]